MNATERSLFVKGLAEFNQQEYFACHETLEELWKDFSGSERELIQGIIQASVALYHLERGNKLGAGKLLKRAQQRLIKFRHQELHVDSLLLAAQLADLETHLETTGMPREPIKIHLST